MSKGFGKIQRLIIEFYESNRSGTTNEVIKNLRYKENIKSHISSIYRSMKLLRKKGILIKSRTRNLLKGTIPDSQLPQSYTLDKNSNAYKRYKNKK